jgi:saccharopine dehydrogenase (NADP+, L-glutamate forming)
MKKVVVLGAGLVAKPLVRYLLDQPDFELTMATRTVSKAEKMIAGHPRGRALRWLTDDHAGLATLIRACDLAISLLPASEHVKVARLCIEQGKHMVTTSYVSPAMRELDAPAKKAGVIVLNEIGVDPGIDHMSAMKVIHEVRDAGGVVVSFKSYCGGLPAPESNNNPFGYKFSWSPRAVLLASRNSARYRKDGKEINIPGEKLFTDVHILHLEGLGDFEAYPNRDSLGYLDVYGLHDVHTMYRGTLRNIGWCDTLDKIAHLGLLDLEVRKGLAGKTCAEFLATIVGGSTRTLKRDIARKLGITEDHELLGKLEWLGLLSDQKIGVDESSPLDLMTEKMNARCPYAPGERDMIALHHQFIAQYPNRKQRITSTLIEFGQLDGDSAMARTVSLPAAIGTRLILEGKIKATGVCIPTTPPIYQPVLAELERLGIVCKETTRPLP